MMKYLLLCCVLAILCVHKHPLTAHCQMPCGIYHDDLVYDRIDQYVETIFKGMTVLNDSKLKDTHDFNEFVRWEIYKEKSSDEASSLITSYFLQQKIKPGEPDTAKRLEAAHKLLFLIVAIKQNTDRKFAEEFADEWDKFKLMFHMEGYECKIEELKMRKRKEKEEQMRKQQENEHHHDDNHEHDHEHEHDHDHSH